MSGGQGGHNHLASLAADNTGLSARTARRYMQLASYGEITLAHYERMCVAIAEAGAVDEVKDIRDKALALEEYSRQAKNTELEAVVVRIRIRAERRAGEMLRDMEKAKGGQPYQSHAATGSQDRTLSDFRISRDQSSRWQKLAAVPKEQFEKALARTEERLSTEVDPGTWTGC